MGKTVESFRMALEGEISRWNGFARALRDEERQAFEALKATPPNLFVIQFKDEEASHDSKRNQQ